MKDLANSPLELYERAYRLHYDESKIPEACRIYKAIIDEFPRSKECGYAVIQLEKILSQDVSERINVASRWTGVLTIVSIFVSICCLIAVIIIGRIYLKSVNSRLTPVSLMSQALGKLAVGKDKDALELLENAKSITRNKDVTPYLLAADIYMKKQQYGMAREELDAVRKLSGSDILVREEMARLKTDEDNSVRKPAAVEKIAVDTNSLQKNVPVAETVKPAPSTPAVKEVRIKPKKESAAPTRSIKQRKSGEARQDSISFF